MDERTTATKTRRHKEKKVFIKNPSCLCVLVAKKAEIIDENRNDNKEGI